MAVCSEHPPPLLLLPVPCLIRNMSVNCMAAPTEATRNPSLTLSASLNCGRTRNVPPTKASPAATAA